MKQAKPLSWRARILIVVLTPVVFFGLLEIGLRIGGYRYEPWEKDLEGWSHDELEQVELGLYEPDPELLWTLRRSARLHLEDAGFLWVRTNAHGLRGEELPGPKPEGEVRVLCLGDSITFGLGALDGETWPDRMEQALREAPELAGRPVRVVNGAVPGYSTVQGMRLLDRLDFLEPDVIVFWYGLPDSHRMYGLPDRFHLLPLEGVRGTLAFLWKLRVFQLVQSLVTDVRRETIEEETRVSRAEFRETVERLLEDERSGGPGVVFVREPERISVTIAQLRRVVARAEEKGVDVILGPESLLEWTMPAPEGADLTGGLIPDGSALRFQPDRMAEREKGLDELRADLEMLRELKRSLDGILAGLPEESLDYDDLFGDLPPGRVFRDNCHLSREGSFLAGRRLAEAAIEVLRKRER